MDIRVAARWREILGDHADRAWQEWFATGHPFALNDRTFYESLIRPCTTFIGMLVRKKA